jgi:hypothetical protein
MAYQHYRNKNEYDNIYIIESLDLGYNINTNKDNVGIQKQYI